MAETKLNTQQLGGNEIVWNEDNLKGSTSVSISEIQKPVIDSDTYGVWHLDNSSANAVTSSLWAGWVDGNGSYVTSDAAKFGTARDLGTDSSTSKIHIYNTNGTRTTLSAVSVDFWLRPTFMDSSTKWNILSVPNSSNGIYNVYFYYVRISSNKIELYDNNTVVGTHATTINTTDFHHYAVSATSAKIKVYFDGVKIFDVARSGQIPLWTDTINGTENRAGLFVVGSRYTVIDEIRVSGIDRWADQDRFTLFTEPYAPAGSDPEYEVKLAASVTSAIEAKANSADLATVATTGAYNDLSGTPTIPTVNNATLTITQGGTTKGTFTANASADVTIDLDAGGGSLPSQTGNAGKFLTTDGTDAAWAAVQTGDSFPSQTGQSGKFLTTDGTDVSWATVDMPQDVYTHDNLRPGTDVTFSEHIEVSTIADDFSASKYVVLNPDVFAPGSYNWYIKIKFKTPAATDNSVNYLLGPTQGFYDYGIAMELGSSGSGTWRIGCGLSSNGAEWNIGWVWQSTYALESDTWYYAKVSYDGVSTYTVSYSTDDSTYDVIQTIESIYPPVVHPTTPGNNWLCIGNTNTHPLGYYKGSVDIGALQIYINNAYAFNGSVDYNNNSKITWYGYGTIPSPTSVSYTTVNSTVDLSTKQDTLVSGTNIKTVNNTSLLGSGNITIESGSSGPTRTWYKNNTGSTITIADTSSAHSVAIYRNGVLLEPTDDYTISGTTLTLVGNPLTASEKITLEVF